MKMPQSTHTTSSDPKIWGPVLWKFLHIMAYNYPENPNPQTKASSRQFFYSLRHLLPCETCRVHYSDLLSTRQPETDSSDSLQEWLLWLHNEVAARTNSDAKPWTIIKLNEWLKNTLSTQQKHKTEHQTQQGLHYSPRSPRSTDKNSSLIIAQQMHKRLSKSRQSSIGKIEKDMNPVDNQPPKKQHMSQPLSQSLSQPLSQPLSLPMPHLIRESRGIIRNSQPVVKNEMQSHRMQSKIEKSHVPKTTHNSFIRKSMTQRNKQNPLTTFRGKANTIRPSTVTHNIVQPPLQSDKADHHHHTYSETSSGTKKTCGCKNK